MNDLRLNRKLHEVYIRETPIRLTTKEYAILKWLMLDRISEDTLDCVENSLKVHISNLRKKLRELSGKDYIESVWGIGFKLREE